MSIDIGRGEAGAGERDINESMARMYMKHGGAGEVAWTGVRAPTYVSPRRIPGLHALMCHHHHAMRGAKNKEVPRSRTNTLDPSISLVSSATCASTAMLRAASTATSRHSGHLQVLLGSVGDPSRVGTLALPVVSSTYLRGRWTVIPPSDTLAPAPSYTPPID